MPVTLDAVPAAGFFPVFPFDAGDQAEPQFVPVASNHTLDGPHNGVTRAIIVVHDETRDANGALASMAILAGNANPAVMILAPQFLMPSDLARVAAHLPQQGHALAVWNAGDWVGGGDSVINSGHKPISAFTVIDLLLMFLADHWSFPDLQTIVVAGYGAGANFTQRYAAFNAAAPVIDRQNINLRYLVAGATSYLYITPNRPLGGRKGYGRPDSAACPDYNIYPYGLEKLNSYARHIGMNAAKTDYVTRFITYINAPAADLFADTHCPALLQGGDGAARAANFHAYLLGLYGDTMVHNHIFAQTKDAKNDAVGLYGSPCATAVLFGDGLCPKSF